MKRYWRLYRPHYAATRKLAIPVIIAQIGQITVGLADNMMIGQLGKTELAGAAFANTLFSLPLIFGMGFAMAITPLIGKATDTDSQNELSSLKHGALIANSLMALLLTGTCIALYLGMPQMQQPAAILSQSQNYFSIISLSIIPLMLFLSGKQIAEGLSNTKLAMRITIGANIINIAGNYLLIFGNLGAPELGLAGAGWSTLLSRCVMAVCMLIYINKAPQFKVLFSFKDIKRISTSTGKIFKLGLPMGIHLLSEASAFIIAGIMMGWISESGLAAHQIVISLSTFGFMLYQGIGVSRTIRISQFSARQVPSLIRNASQASIQIAAVMVLVISGTFIALRHVLPRLFTDDAEVIALASNMIIVLVVFQVFDAIQIIYSSILRGMADATIPGILTFVSYFLFAIPFSYWAAFKGGYGEIGIWLGFPLGLSICALLFHIRIRFLHKKLAQLPISK